MKTNKNRLMNFDMDYNLYFEVLKISFIIHFFD